MTVRCVKSRAVNGDSREYITAGKEYVVLEIIFTQGSARGGFAAFYRIIDNNGFPGMYAGEDFVTAENDLEGMVMCEEAYGYVITHRLIAESRLGGENVNGFWGALFEENNAEALDLVKKAVMDLRGETEVPEILLS